MLEGWGWTWEQAVCLSQCWVPASLPVLPLPSSALLSAPGKGARRHRHIKKYRCLDCQGAPNP